MDEEIYKGKLDLLIIDIDDTFIYHRTVAAANKIFLELVYSIFNKKLKEDIYATKKSFFLIFNLIFFNFFRIRINKNIKKIVKLIKTGIYLHILNIIRKINNRFFKIISCEKMIKVWVETVIDLQIEAEDYEISERVIKNNIYKNVFDIYKSLKSKYVLAITESFNIKEDPIKKILDINEIISNRFISKKRIISGYEINVSKGEDKKRIVEKVIKKVKAKNIGIFIEDYDDVELLKLKNLRFIAYNKRLRRFIPKDIVAFSF